MGKFNSSLTRVQPVFNALYKRDSSGETWVKLLLQMAKTKDHPISIIKEPSLGHLIKPPYFEFPVGPPKSFLKWLIEHPKKLSSPPESIWRKWSDTTQEMRRDLLSGDKVAQAKAITELENSKSYNKSAWWRFEGVTYVDCALFTDSTVIFVEGKRTEIGPSKEVLWYKCRNQLHRNIECAAAYAKRGDLQHYFVMMVVDEDMMKKRPVRQYEVDAVTSPTAIDESFPHLTNKDRMELISHYLGVTTWQDIVERFDLGNKVLL